MAQLLGFFVAIYLIMMIVGVVVMIAAVIGSLVLLFFLFVAIAKACEAIYENHQARRRDREIAEYEHRAALRRIANRAERQHQLYLQGDSRGLYGMYMPIDLSEPMPPMPKVHNKKKKKHR